MRGIVLGVALALALAGCGQKGPLYLPEPEDRPAQESTS